MTDTENLPCEHGRQRRKCETCELEKAEKELHEIELTLAWAKGVDESLPLSVQVHQLAEQRDAAEARVLELEKLAVEASEVLKLKDARLAECAIREKGMAEMAALLMNTFGFGGPEHKDTEICEFATEVLRGQFIQGQKLIKENDKLKWQIANWERKEVHKASCCADNEEIAEKLEKEHKDLLNRLSDAHLANDKLRDEMRDLREDHAYVTGEDWMTKHDNLSIEFVKQQAQEEETLRILHTLTEAFVELNPRYGVFSGWQSLFSAVRKDYAQLVEENKKFGRDMSFHLCKSGEIKPYPGLLCAKGCTQTDFNVLEALKRKNDKKIQKHLTEAKAEMDRTHGSWLTVKEHIDAVLDLIDWQEPRA